MIEPLKKVSMAFDGELIIVDDPEKLREPQALFATGPRLPGYVSWTHEAESPIHGGEPVNDSVPTMYGRDFSLGHFNQHGRVHGEIRVGAERWPIDGRGWRDHSWGPRYWQAIFYYRLFIANFANGNGFMLLKITDKHGVSRRQCCDRGQYENHGARRRDRMDGQPRPPRDAGVRTARRKALITGEIIKLAPLRNRRKADGETLVSRIAEGFTRYSWDGRTGYGMTEYIERIEGGKLVGYPL